jgi:hypothetical protein
MKRILLAVAAFALLLGAVKPVADIPGPSCFPVVCPTDN